MNASINTTDKNLVEALVILVLRLTGNRAQKMEISNTLRINIKCHIFTNDNKSTVTGFVQIHPQRNQKIEHMQRLSISFRLVAIATVLLFSSCKKDTSSNAPGANGNTVTVNARTATPGQQARVSLSQQDIARLKQQGVIKLEDHHDAVIPGASTSAPAPGGGGGGGDEWDPGNCPPVSQATLNYYQAQANSCCCSFTVCLQGANCWYYIYYFTPSGGSGCNGGGGGPWDIQ